MVVASTSVLMVDGTLQIAATRVFAPRVGSSCLCETL